MRDQPIFGVPGGPALCVETPDGVIHTQGQGVADGPVYGNADLTTIPGDYVNTAPTPPRLR